MSEIETFARFCSSTLTAEDARPLALEPFQRDFLGDHFDGAREVVTLLPKKNGKSSILAGLALYHVLSVPFAEVAVVAASRDQASNLLRQSQGFIRRAPSLQRRLRVKQREIVNDDLGGRVRVLASDVDTFDGWLGTLGLVDELHRHRSPELYGLIREGIGPRGGSMVTISTAGDDESSPLGRLRAKALALPGLRRDGAHRQVRDATFAFHEWSLDPDADVDDLDLVLAANPASWIDVAELQRRRTASMRIWQWKRFTCGIWTHGEDAAISDKEWRACAVAGTEIPDGAGEVTVGIDLGWRHDCTALVAIRPNADGIVDVHPPTVFTPPGDGTSLDADEVFAAAAGMVDRWPGLTFVLDPEAGGEQLAQRLDKELGDCTVATHSQKTGPMCRAAERLSAAIAEKRIRHPDDPALNAHVLAAAAKPVGESWKFVKQRGRRSPIDALIGLAMAYSVTASEPEPSREVIQHELRERPGVYERQSGNITLRGDHHRDRQPGEGGFGGPRRGR